MAKKKLSKAQKQKAASRMVAKKSTCPDCKKPMKACKCNKDY